MLYIFWQNDSLIIIDDLPRINNPNYFILSNFSSPSVGVIFGSPYYILLNKYSAILDNLKSSGIINYTFNSYHSPILKIVAF